MQSVSFFTRLSSNIQFIWIQNETPWVSTFCISGLCQRGLRMDPNSLSPLINVLGKRMLNRRQQPRSFDLWAVRLTPAATLRLLNFLLTRFAHKVQSERKAFIHHSASRQCEVLLYFSDFATYQLEPQIRNCALVARVCTRSAKRVAGKSTSLRTGEYEVSWKRLWAWRSSGPCR